MRHVETFDLFPLFLFVCLFVLFLSSLSIGISIFQMTFVRRDSLESPFGVTPASYHRDEPRLRHEHEPYVRFACGKAPSLCFAHSKRLACLFIYIYVDVIHEIVSGCAGSDKNDCCEMLNVDYSSFERGIIVLKREICTRVAAAAHKHPRFFPFLK